MGGDTVLAVFSGIYCGSVVSADYWPIAAALAAVFFLAATATPFISEQRSLGRGFKQLERQYFESRRQQNKAQKIEVFGAPPPAPSFRRLGAARRTMLVLTAIGVGLLAYDIGDWWLQRPPPPPSPGLITNF